MTSRRLDGHSRRLEIRLLHWTLGLGIRHRASVIAAIAIASLSALSAAPPTQTFTGTITDDMCALAGHASMRMGPTDAECTRACVNIHGASYVLLVGKNVYVLSDQTTPDRWAGQKVKVVGTLDAKTKTIRVESIAAA